jgi:hypothetical protein
MDEALQYLVHFFTDREHLFKTIMMADACQVEAISDQFAAQKGWYWGRYARSEREVYLARRRFIEKAMYDDFTQLYGPLKERAPVYFYLYPNITAGQVIAKAQQRTQHEEVEPGVLLVKTQDLEELSNITFTLNDSFTAYWQKANQAGINSRGPQPSGIVLPDHNKVFPFSMISEMHRKYQEQEMVYEVQVWDYQLLERIRYTILGEEHGQA